MKSPEDQDLLSQYLDGELTPNRAKLVQDRLREDPELERLHDRLRRMSEVTREVFQSDESTLPNIEASREDFIRTSLVGGASVLRRDQVLIPRWVPLLVVVGVVVAAVLLVGNDRISAEEFEEAVALSIRPRGSSSITVERSSVLGRVTPSMEILYDSDDRWVVEASDWLLVPAVLNGGRSGVIRSPERRIYVGSDGQTMWLLLEGEDEVRVVDIEGPVSMIGMLRSFRGEESSVGQAVPLVNWTRVQEVLEGISDGHLEYVRAGEETIAGERLERFDVTLTDQVTAQVWMSREAGAIRRLRLGLVTMTFQELREVPDPSVFHWSSRAPTGVHIERVRRE